MNRLARITTGVALGGATVLAFASMATAHNETPYALCVDNKPKGGFDASAYDGADFHVYNDFVQIDHGSFTTGLSKSYDLGDPTKPHTFRVVIDAPGAQYDHDDSIPLKACVTAPPSTTGAPTSTAPAPTTQPATTAAVSTTASTVASTIAPSSTAAPTTGAASSTLPVSTASPATSAMTSPSSSEVPRSSSPAVSPTATSESSAPPAVVASGPDSSESPASPAPTLPTASTSPSASDDVVLGTVAGTPPSFTPETTALVPPQLPPALPATGFNPGPWFAVGGIVIVAGAGLLVARRRPKVKQ